VDSRGADSASTSPIAAARGAAGAAEGREGARDSSTNEFHSPHSGQRPSHFGAVAPQL